MRLGECRSVRYVSAHKIEEYKNQAAARSDFLPVKLALVIFAVLLLLYVTVALVTWIIGQS